MWSQLLDLLYFLLGLCNSLNQGVIARFGVDLRYNRHNLGAASGYNTNFRWKKRMCERVGQTKRPRALPLRLANDVSWRPPSVPRGRPRRRGPDRRLTGGRRSRGLRVSTTCSEARPCPGFGRLLAPAGTICTSTNWGPSPRWSGSWNQRQRRWHEIVESRGSNSTQTLLTLSLVSVTWTRNRVPGIFSRVLFESKLVSPLFSIDSVVSPFLAARWR